MEINNEKRHRFGLVGKNISYSFSRGYFADKFDQLGFKNHSYENFDLETIDKFPDMIRSNPELQGLNVTIPYKEVIIPLLDKLDPEAQEIGAVNTICFTSSGIKGYNTDIIGFRESLRPLLLPHDKKALILGTGGASKAVAHALETLDIQFKYVSRTPTLDQLSYTAINADLLTEFTVIIQCTPKGTFPNIADAPDLPYSELGPNHLLYDLIYNPEMTSFLKQGKARGARVKNGLEMLQIQAEAAWKLWNQQL